MSFLRLMTRRRFIGVAWNPSYDVRSRNNAIYINRSEIRAVRKLLHRSSSSLFGNQRSFFHTSSVDFLKKEDEEDDKKKGNEDKSLMLKALMQLAIPLAFFYFMVKYTEGSRPQSDAQETVIQEVSWHDFYTNMLLAGEVESVQIIPAVRRARVFLYPDAIYKGQRVKNRIFEMNIPSAENLEDRIREAEYKLEIHPGQGMSIIYKRDMEGTSRLIAAILSCILIGILAMALRSLSASISSANPMKSFQNIRKADFTLINPKIKTGKGTKFSDVAGLHEAKIEVREFVDYLKHPAKYSELGAKPPKGAILYGPPGCGKTLLAKAVANESDVPFLSMAGSEFMEMIGGVGAARVRSLFEEAGKRAPSIIFIDEIDAIGQNRSGSQRGGQEMEQTLNQLLVEMDGMSTREGVIVLAATNRSEVLDKALLRPGRFDRHITIDYPTISERKEILEQHMKGVALEESSTKYSQRLATLTPGFSGADLANLINEAALHAARRKSDNVKLEDLEYAVERVIAGPVKKSNTLSQPERRIVAYHETGHALVGWMLRHTDALLKVTILPRTSMALGFAQYTPMDKKLFSPEELLDRMCMALGGRVAESLTFNKVTTGAQNDLEKVTKIAYAQIRQFGFNEIVGLMSYEDRPGQKPVYGKKLHATMDLEARKLIAHAYKLTEKILQDNKDKLEIMAEELLVKETLNYEDVEKLLGPPKYGKKHLISPADFEASLHRQAELGKENSSSS